MLETRKTIELNGEIKKGDALIITMSATVHNESISSTSFNLSVVDKDLYEEEIERCRKEIAEFQEKIYELEDAMFKGEIE